MSLEYQMPGGKKRKAYAEWPNKDLPTLPLLTNTKPIAKHTKLVALEDQKLSKYREDQKKAAAAST